MKKTFTFLLMALLALAGFKSWGQESQTITIGTGTETNQDMPFNSFYNYSYAQMLYLGNEIGESGTITSISFYAGASVNGYLKLKIYMKCVDRNSYSNSNDWESVTAGDLVYENDSYYAYPTGWITFTLDEPFQYDNSKNLMIAFDNNTGTYYSSKQFRYTNTSSTTCIYQRSDGTNIDPLSPSQADGPANYRPNIQITMLPAQGNTINYATLTGGTISGPSKAEEGATVTLSATPAHGYDFVAGSWVVTKSTGGTVDVINNQFTMPDCDVTVSATFTELPRHTVNVINPTDGGSTTATLSATPSTNVLEGDEVRLSYSDLAEGYKFVNYVATNASTSEPIAVQQKWDNVNYVNYNYFTMPDANVNLTASVKLIRTINVAEMQHGSITLSPNPQYDQIVAGETITISPNPDYGYALESLTITKVSGDTITPVEQEQWEQIIYTFEMPEDDVNIAATFASSGTLYTVTLPEETEIGRVSAYPADEWESSTEYFENDNVRLNVYVKNNNYHIKDVVVKKDSDQTVVDFDEQSESNYYFTMPADNVTVTVTFEENPRYLVSIETTENGTVSLIDAPADNKYYQGQQVKLNVTPDPGCMLNGLTYTYGETTTDVWYDNYWGYYYFTMPEAAVTINASFIMGITVHDGYETNDLIPIRGSYTDTYNTQSQFIFPAADLQDIADSKITDLIFYSANVSWDYSFSPLTWNVFMKEVDYTAPSSFLDWDNMTNVYYGTITISGSKLSIHLSTPFEYNGGNLMVGFRENEYSNFSQWTQWYGVTDTDDNRHSIVLEQDYTNTINSFLPKTTIIYEPIVNYAITLVQPEDEDEIGTIAADMTEAAEGKTVTLSFNPKQYDDHSYRVSSWNVKKTDDETVTVTVASDNTFEMPAYPVTVSAVIETVLYYALTIDEEIEGGTIEAYPAEHLELGQRVELSASPAQHYRFAEWNITEVPSGDAFVVPALPNTSFNMPASALNVSATFEAYLPHTITLPEDVAEGYVTASQTEGLYCYDNVTLTVHPAEHCSLQSIVIMAGETPVSYTQDGNNYYFSMPDGDVTVTATFAENSKYTVSLVYNEDGGSINVGSSTEFYAGDDVYVYFTIETGYILNSLEAEDSNQNAIAMSKYTNFYIFDMPEDNVTVTAEFVHGITVNDGISTNEIVPIYGYNADANTKSQFIIPEASLVDMKNGKIESMVFYLNNSDNHTFNGNWKVYIKVVNITTLSNYETLSADEKVYEGDMVITNGKMTLNIPEEKQCEYRGGNLLIGFEQTQVGNWLRTYWMGVNQSSNTAYAGYSSWGYDYSQARQFLPKVTFLYEPGEPLPEYTITFHSNGIVSEQTITEGQSLPNPTNIPAGLTFAGWAAADIATYTEEEPEYVTAARAEEDLYAVFSYSEAETTSKGAGTWIKVTDVNELANNDKVVLVYSNMIVGQRGSDDYSFTALSNDLTIVGDAITNIPDNAIEFTLQQNGGYWNLNYYDAKESEETSLAFGEFYMFPASLGWGSNKWTAESNSGAVVFKVTDGNNRYIGYNSSMKVVSSSGNKCNVYKASAPVVTHYYYMTEVFTNGSITADTELKNIIITEGMVTVDNNIVLTMNENGLFRNKDAANFVFGYGAQLITDNAGVLATMKKHINGTDWYTISSPLAAASTEFADVTSLIPTSVEANNYDLYRLNEADGMWENARVNEGEAFTTIDKGRGYLYANATEINHIAFAGEINVTNVECTLTNDAAHGFNLIGNPFSQNIKLTDVKSDGTAVLADGFYVLNNDETWGTELTTEEIKPLQGFLVQATTAGDVTISKPTSAPSKGERSNEQSTNIELIVSNANFKDNAYAMFGEGNGLNKVSHRNAQAPMIYIPQDGEDFAIAFMDENTTVFPLSFKAMTTGSYSISLKATDNISTLVLVDNQTGTETNMLLEESYQFIGSPRDGENRFTVKLGISHNDGQSDSEHFVYQNGSELVINGEGTLQIFDVLGRVVVSEEVHGQTVNVGGLTTGAYVVRMTGNEVKTQKIIIR